jgi:hypothetical protein
LNQESFPEAEGEFKRVIELQPKNADAHLFMGLALAAEQNHQVPFKSSRLPPISVRELAASTLKWGSHTLN